MPVDVKKSRRLEAAGGRVTSVEEWLDLTAEEVAVLDMKIRLGEAIKARRGKMNISQARAAEILKTSQGRVSKLEHGRATLDQLARSLLALGGSTREVGRAIAG